MSRNQQFSDKVRQCLNILNDDLESVLKQLVEYDYPQEVSCLSFEIFVDGFTQGFPVNCFFMDSGNTEYFEYVDGKAKYPSPVDSGLLQIESVYPEELEEEFEDIEDDLWNISTQEMIGWFSERWLSVGGDKFTKDANIAPHDSIHEFNLINSRWQQSK